MSQELSPLEGLVPKNRGSAKRIGPFKVRNLIEAIIFTIPVIMLVVVIPFVFTVKCVLIGTLGGATAIVCLTGIRNKSVTEAIYLRIKQKATRRCLKLRSVEDAKRKKFEEKDQSAIIKTAEKITEYFSDENLNKKDAEKDKKKQIARVVKDAFETFKSALGG